MRGSTAGMSEGMIAPSDNIHTMFLTFVDVMFSSLVLAPLIVCYWRGTWNCMDHMLDGQLGAAHGGLASLAIGIGGHLVCTMAQQRLARAVHPDRHRIAYFVVSRCYTYAYGVVCVNGWRGGWALLSQSLPLTVAVTAPVTLLAVGSLVLLKGLRNVSAAPFAVATDHSKDYFVFPTMFKKVAALRVWVGIKLHTLASTTASMERERDITANGRVNGVIAPLIAPHKKRVWFRQQIH